MSARPRGSAPGGPFGHAAHDLRAHGLAVLPIDGKVPLVRNWTRWSKPPGRAFVDKLIRQHPEAGIGVVCGLSRVTLVDVDDPALVEPMVRRCGETPLVTGTPSGGCHLWFRSSGERCANLRGEGLAVDVKAAGGFVAVPPSPGYSFRFGSWSDLPNLPAATPGSLPAAQGYENRTHSLRAIGVGHRNTTLFRLLLRRAAACDTEADLLDVAETIVADHCEVDPRHPLAPAEIAKTVASVWYYERAGHNWAGKEARAVTTATELHVLQRNPDAYVLRSLLQCMHGARHEPFALAVKALAADQFVDGWTDFKRYASARDWLVEHDFLVLVHRGGRGPRDPHLYRLASPGQATTDNQLPHQQSPKAGGEGCSVILGTAGGPLAADRKTARRA